MELPLISVIMPVFNREEFIAEAIQSILSQTYKNFELIIIDDASTDRTLKEISQFNDKRIIVLKNEGNKGVSASRNLGIEKAKGEFIAFMDSDDISRGDRLEKQLIEFSSNMNLNICGSWIRFLHSDKTIQFKENHNEILTNLLLSCSLSIGTAMIKKSLFDSERLCPSLNHGEDYELWSRLCWMGEMYNIPEALLLYRTHEDQLSGIYKPEQLKMDADIRLSLFKKLNYSRTEFPDELIKEFFLFDKYFRIAEFSRFLKWLKYIKKKNRIEQVFPLEEFDKVIEEIRKNLLFKIYFKKNSIGLTKRWRIKSLVSLRKREALGIIVKKLNIG